MSDIGNRRWALEKGRRDEHKKVMAEYDRTVYYPALKQLRAECAAEGHGPTTAWHDNGIGWSWNYCTKCQTRLNITGPDGATAAD